MKDRAVLMGAFLTLLARSICVKFRRVLDERNPWWPIPPPFPPDDGPFRLNPFKVNPFLAEG